MGGAFLAWALAAFAGSGAVDALSEGPDWVWSAVDHRPCKRVGSEGLDHDPTPDDIEAFLGRLQTALDDREWELKGLTTAGSPLDPEPIRTVLGDVRPQLGTFHVIKDLTKGIRQARATERKR